MTRFLPAPLDVAGTALGGIGFLIMLDGGLLLRQQWLLWAGFLTMTAAGLLLIGSAAAGWWERRTERRTRTAMGLPAARGLWHPAGIGALWFAAFIPATFGFAHAIDWYADRQPRTSAIWDERVMQLLAAMFLGYYWFAAAVHVIAQAAWRRRDRRRVRREESAFAGDTAAAPTGPFLIPDRLHPHLTEARARWRKALRQPPNPNPGLESRPRSARVGYLGLFAFACTMSLFMWTAFTWGFLTGPPDIFTRVFLGCTWTAVSVFMANLVLPDVIELARQLIRALRLP